MLKPDPPSSLGNPPPPYAETVALPDAPPAREGRVVGIATGVAGVDLATCRKILVVKLDFIGDWVLTTPFLAGLRQAAPDAEITAVVLDRVYDLAAPCGLVDRIIAVPGAASGPVRFGAGSADDLAAFLGDVRSGAFDLALVPRWDTDFNGATRIAGLSGARQVVGFSERCTPRKQRRECRLRPLSLGRDPRSAPLPRGRAHAGFSRCPGRQARDAASARPDRG